ncbi:DUF4075 domain-containing protein, partial [Ectobacillus panaciterrae]|uniref:DUF4075 domain-containing protein n=1 Tax=Ectobacillus panaciterrae TaxID=363872 RepID=UPI0006846D92
MEKIEKKNNIVRNIAIGVAVGAAVTMIKKSNRDKVAYNVRKAKTKMIEIGEKAPLKSRVMEGVQAVGTKGRELADLTAMKQRVGELTDLTAMKQRVGELTDLTAMKQRVGELTDLTAMKQKVGEFKKLTPAVVETLKETRDIFNKKKQELKKQNELQTEETQELQAAAPGTEELKHEAEAIVAEDG